MKRKITVRRMHMRVNPNGRVSRVRQHYMHINDMKKWRVVGSGKSKIVESKSPWSAMRDARSYGIDASSVMQMNPAKIGLHHVEGGRDYLHILESNPARSFVDNRTGVGPRQFRANVYTIKVDRRKMIYG